jgi:hypothetical protein
MLNVLGHESRVPVGDGPDYVQANYPQNGLQEAQNVRDAAGNGAHVASANGESKIQ